jgi:hypothetical protein
VKLYIQKICFLLCLFVIPACLPPATPTQATTPEPQPTSAQDYHPLETRVGIEEIDSVIEAVASREPQILHPLVKFTKTKCTMRDGLGGPPKCSEGEAEGTPVEVLPFLSSEGGFIRKDEIENWQGIEASGLYAVYRVSADVRSEEFYPVGEKAIIFSAPESRPASSLRLSAGRIVRVDQIFDTSPESLDAILKREASELILAPVSR